MVLLCVSVGVPACFIRWIDANGWLIRLLIKEACCFAPWPRNSSVASSTTVYASQSTRRKLPPSFYKPRVRKKMHHRFNDCVDLKTNLAAIPVNDPIIVLKHKTLFTVNDSFALQRLHCHSNPQYTSRPSWVQNHLARGKWTCSPTPEQRAVFSSIFCCSKICCFLVLIHAKNIHAHAYNHKTGQWEYNSQQKMESIIWQYISNTCS
jgi:hypothetical protein